MSVTKKETVSGLSSLIGTTVVVRSTLDGSERRGIIRANDSVNNKVRIDQGKGHFWQSTTTTGVYIFSDNF